MSAHIKEAILIAGGFGSLYSLFRYAKKTFQGFDSVIDFECRREFNDFIQERSVLSLVHIKACIENERAEGAFYSPYLPSPVKRLR
ncbi:unnamed protein product [Blepharisma stoltei]|uniref:Uncharacterized protein n=1 Tax=Blepharisma stoltei TaxID=1481888 RepID=A0AAU9K272_9CILI|nr:unnamed protein product [Blepharisma stoltei]